MKKHLCLAYIALLPLYGLLAEPTASSLPQTTQTPHLDPTKAADYLLARCGIVRLTHDRFSANQEPQYGFTYTPLQFSGKITKYRGAFSFDIDLAEMIRGFTLYERGKPLPMQQQLSHALKVLNVAFAIDPYFTLQLGRLGNYVETRTALATIFHFTRFDISLAWNIPLRERFLHQGNPVDKFEKWFEQYTLGFRIGSFDTHVSLDFLNEKIEYKLRSLELGTKKWRFAYSAVGFPPFATLQSPFYYDELDTRYYGILNDPKYTQWSHALQFNYLFAPLVIKANYHLHAGIRMQHNLTGHTAVRFFELAIPILYTYTFTLKTLKHSKLTCQLGILPSLSIKNSDYANDEKGNDDLFGGWKQFVQGLRQDPTKLRYMGKDLLYSLFRTSFHIQYSF